MLEDRPREVVEIRLALLAPVLLCALPSRALLDDWLALTAVDTRHRRAEAGATESLTALVPIRKEHFDCVFVHHLERTNPSSVEVTTHRVERTENPNKQGRKRPWVRFEREYAGVTTHMDWYHNDRGDQVLAVEDDASRRVFDMIETESSSAHASVELPDSVVQNLDPPVPILEVITDHRSEFINTRQDERPSLDHEFEHYLHENNIKHSLCKVGRSQSNGKLERFFQTYEKQRWRFDSLPEFLDFYNKERPHMSLKWDKLETPYEAFHRLLPDPEADLDDPLKTEVTTDE